MEVLAEMMRKGLRMEPTGFADGLDVKCEKKRRVKNGSKVYDLIKYTVINEKEGVEFFYPGRDQEFGFDHVRLEMTVTHSSEIIEQTVGFRREAGTQRVMSICPETQPSSCTRTVQVSVNDLKEIDVHVCGYPHRLPPGISPLNF